MNTDVTVGHTKCEAETLTKQDERLDLVIGAI